MMRENHKQHINDREFISLITANQRRIRAYVLTLVPNLSDAEDIMQETTIFMWEKKADFKPETDFVAWGSRIAYFKVLDYRKKMKKQRRLMIFEEQFKNIEALAFENSRHLNDTVFTLQECIKKLAKPDKQLLHLKYSVELTAREISSRINRSMRFVYLSISRIQKLLINCMEGYERE